MIYSDPQLTHLNRKAAFLPAPGAPIRVLVAGVSLSGTFEAAADVLARGSEEIESVDALVHVPGRGRVCVALSDVEVL